MIAAARLAPAGTRASSGRMARRTLLVALAVTAAVAVGAGAYVRLAPMDAARWHVDPEEAVPTGRPNQWLLAPGADGEPIVTDAAPAEALARLEAAALAEGGVERLAGSPEEGLVTWVQRSRLVGYPDAITARAVPEGEGSRVTILSRSRYGHSDMGVNRARVERWVAAAGL